MKLVGAIRALRTAVAHLGRRDAAAVRTGKLLLLVALSNSYSLVRGGRRRGGSRSTTVRRLIGSVEAVRKSVADLAPGDAGGIVAAAKQPEA